jgi:hypothetical protein
VDDPEKILLRVASCAWISRPMTVSQSISGSDYRLVTSAEPAARATGAERYEKHL